jgi:6-phosphogluconolactonase
MRLSPALRSLPVKLNNSPHLRIRRTPEEAADLCAAYILERLSEALTSQPRATLAISGGSTPKPLFSAMAEAGFSWSKVHIFWVDERCVPPADDQSNFKLANDTLLKPAGIRPENIHRIYGEMDPAQAAARYLADILAFFELKHGELPEFDLIHRGMGADAHTASLFPGSDLIKNHTDIAAHVWVEHLKVDRVTLLPGVLEAAKRTVLQVSGLDKANAVRHVLRDGEDFLNYPCQIASRDSRATWFLDEAAAEKL